MWIRCTNDRTKYQTENNKLLQSLNDIFDVVSSLLQNERVKVEWMEIGLAMNLDKESWIGRVMPADRLKRNVSPLTDRQTLRDGHSVSTVRTVLCTVMTHSHTPSCLVSASSNVHKRDYLSYSTTTSASHL